MALIKISELTEETTPADGDFVPIVDVSTNSTKKATRTNLFKNPPLADTSITPAMLQTGTGSSWAWQSWTPTLSGRFDDAKWTKTCKYIQIGKTVFFELKLVASTTTPMSGGTTDALFTLPVTAASSYSSADKGAVIGNGGSYDSGTAIAPNLVGILNSSTTVGFIRTNALAVYTSTSPWTWTTSDEILATGFYEAA